MRRGGKGKWIGAAALAAGIFLLSLCVGRYPLKGSEVLKCLLQHFFSLELGMTPQQMGIAVGNRLPRAFAGALVGAALAASGCAFQGLFRNPLVSQGVLGVSSGAGFGAALSIVLFSGSGLAPEFAFVFGLAAVWLSFLTARMCGEVTALMLVLGGTIVSSIFSALLSLLKYAADPDHQLASIVFWNMGSLASVESGVFPYSAGAMLVGMLLLLASGWAINVLSMGDGEARSLGLPVGLSRMTVVAGATLATAGAVSVCGNIGWVGLIVPHMARFLVGSDNRKLIPFSMLLGASFLMLVDLLCRTLTGAEIPLGIMTALIGGPFFLYLLRRYKGGGWK